MKGKNVIVTGATGGIGAATAREFARAGARVIMMSRSKEKLDAIADGIRSEVPNAEVDVEPVDLGDVASVRRAVESIKSRYDAIDVLINNAAIYKKERVMKGEMEEMFATNHLGPFTLTVLLEPLLKKRGARVLNVTAPSTSTIPFEDLNAAHEFKAFNRFGASKMANLVFTFELARRWKGSGVTTDAMHPGLVKSDLMGEAAAPIRFLLNLISSTPQKPALALVKLAGETGVDGQGRFFQLTKPIKAAQYALEPQIATKLWDVSMQLAGAGL
jgi:NAD(P)-dependent dehydrogenase (short-subunit alcohol dehydrogenase family)